MLGLACWPPGRWRRTGGPRTRDWEPLFKGMGTHESHYLTWASTNKTEQHAYCSCILLYRKIVNIVGSILITTIAKTTTEIKKCLALPVIWQHYMWMNHLHFSIYHTLTGYQYLSIEEYLPRGQTEVFFARWHSLPGNNKNTGRIPVFSQRKLKLLMDGISWG